MKHDYSKLRPYYLSDAEVGDAVLGRFGGDPGKVIAVTDKGNVVIEWGCTITAFKTTDGHRICAKPLAWLGDTPLYKGDPIYLLDKTHPGYRHPYVLDRVEMYCGVEIIYCMEGEEFPFDAPGEYLDPTVWSLTEPVRTLTINGHDVPEPVRKPLENGQKYWVAATDVDGPFNTRWDDDSADNTRLALGLVHLTKEAATLHTEALLSFTKK